MDKDPIPSQHGGPGNRLKFCKAGRDRWRCHSHDVMAVYAYMSIIRELLQIKRSISLNSKVHTNPLAKILSKWQVTTTD
uniref:Uncharacterized protein n=1 Tax=Arion vulgaris TaxID=1028688 RepID=A0A0B7BFA8_9EUPU